MSPVPGGQKGGLGIKIAFSAAVCLIFNLSRGVSSILATTSGIKALEAPQMLCEERDRAMEST